ncbi:MAG: transposase [Synechococcaceae cyanobacterium SM1_2_3]|nr:transposase [Synechococcaceae cyanobacterium SM1_2_3]
MNTTRIGLDIAKQMFQVHGVDKLGKVIPRKTLKRNPVTAFFANVPFCLMGLEAGGGSHDWQGS